MFEASDSQAQRPGLSVSAMKFRASEQPVRKHPDLLAPSGRRRSEATAKRPNVDQFDNAFKCTKTSQGPGRGLN
jgi:hypothetical protein